MGEKSEIHVPENLEGFLSGEVLDEYACRAPDQAIRQLQLYLDEASFFYPSVKKLIDEVKPATILEVGSGVGLLSLLMSEAGARVVSIEPFSAGFRQLEDFRALLLRAWLGKGDPPHFRSAYVQDLVFEGLRFDLVLAVHVIEHVPKWRDMLDSIVSVLGESARAVVICPNYSFPYEQHLEVPIIFSKKLTWFFLGRAVTRAAVVEQVGEFWADLSWPKVGRIREFLKSRDLRFQFSRALIDRYFDRLLDPRFLSRKGPFFGFLSSAAFWIRPLSRMVPVRWLPLIELTIERQTKDVLSDGR